MTPAHAGAARNIKSAVIQNMANNSLTVFSFNFAGLPLITKNYRLRLALLLDFLPSVEADIFCFQEVWSKKAQRKIIKRLGQIGCDYFYQTPSFRPNGLLVVSRYPVGQGQFYPIESYFYDFKRLVMELPLFLKGYQAMDLILPKTKIKLFNVHFRIGWGQELLRESKPKTINRQAVGGLIDQINLLGEKKIILAGDFNIRPGEGLYNQIVDLAKVEPVSPIRGKIVLPVIFRWPIAPGSGITDHIFIKNFPNSFYQAQIIANQPLGGDIYLSDHAALLTKIYWKK